MAVVSDLENHQLTFFNFKSCTFVRNFGSKGENRGQFSYPRGLAVTHWGHIVVSDTNRIQVFNIRDDNEIDCLHEIILILPKPCLFYAISCYLSRNAVVVSEFNNCQILTVALDDLDQFDRPRIQIFQFDDYQLSQVSPDGPSRSRFNGKVHMRGVCVTETNRVWGCAVNDEWGNEQWTLFHFQ